MLLDLWKSLNIVHDSGIANFKFKDFYTAVDDLSACVKLDKDNTSAYTYLVGLKDEILLILLSGISHIAHPGIIM